MPGGGRPACTVARVLVLLVVVVATVAPAQAQTASWRDLLERGVQEGQRRPFEGRLVVVSFDADAPVIGEVTVTQNATGALMTSASAAWVLGRERGRTFFGDADSGSLLRVGSVEQTGFSLDRLDDKYDVRVEGEGTTVLGEARVLAVREDDELRERLFIDPGSGLIVRRETYGEGGVPIRLVAFTSLDLNPGRVPDIEDTAVWSEAETDKTDKTEMNEDAVEILRDIGWVAPHELPGGYGLVDAAALGEEGSSSLHLLYSDGLYAVSIYQQDGRLDGSAVMARGARPATLGTMHVYRWPGAEPATVVWTGDDRTYTAVSDAPLGVLHETLAALPHEPAPGPLTRLRRGLRRVGGWLWPFG